MNLENDVKTGLSKIETLKGEIAVKLHLASMEAKQEWNDVLEPKVHAIADTAKHYTDDAKKAVEDLAHNLSAFVGKLTGPKTDGTDEKKA